MSKRQWLIIFGICVATLPFLGFPKNWNMIASVLLGLLIVVVAYRSFHSPQDKKTDDYSSLPYSEYQNKS